MKYQFQTWLSKNKLQESDLSASLRKSCENIRKLEGAVVEAKGKMSAGNLSVAMAKKTQQQIDDSEVALPQMDTDLVAKLEKWLPNREKYAAQGARLQAGKSGQAAGQTSTQEPAKPVPTPASTTAQTPAKTATATVKKGEEKVTPATEEGKSKIGVGGWLLIGLGVLVLGGGAIALARKASAAGM